MASAGSMSREQPPCGGCRPHPLPSSGETPPTPVWRPDDCGDLQPVPLPYSLPSLVLLPLHSDLFTPLDLCTLPINSETCMLCLVLGDEGGGMELHPPAP